MGIKFFNKLPDDIFSRALLHTRAKECTTLQRIAANKNYARRAIDGVLAAVSISQKLAQTGLVFVFLQVFLVLVALHRRRCPQQRARRGLDDARGINLLQLLLFRHGSI